MMGVTAGVQALLPLLAPSCKQHHSRPPPLRLLLLHPLCITRCPPPHTQQLTYSLPPCPPAPPAPATRLGTALASRWAAALLPHHQWLILSVEHALVLLAHKTAILEVGGWCVGGGGA